MQSLHVAQKTHYWRAVALGTRNRVTASGMYGLKAALAGMRAVTVELQTGIISLRNPGKNDVLWLTRHVTSEPIKPK